MDEVMKLLKINNLPLQPGTADLVFRCVDQFVAHFHVSLIRRALVSCNELQLNVCRICHDTDNWDLLAKYSKNFCKAGVKLRKTTFDVWMEFAAKRGTFSVVGFLSCTSNDSWVDRGVCYNHSVICT